VKYHDESHQNQVEFSANPKRTPVNVVTTGIRKSVTDDRRNPWKTRRKRAVEPAVRAHSPQTWASEQSHLRTIAALREKLQRKNEVVAELMEEHIQLKKELGDL
jgi:hypothetical protein